MKIAVFDENSNNSSYLKQSIYTFSNLKNFELVIDVFSNINDFLKSKPNYILYFIAFKTKADILLAQKLLQKNTETPIVVTADDTSLAVEAFKINAYNFLHTPFRITDLYDVLENFFSSYLSNALLINNGLENVYINTSDILYLEADNKRCQIHTKNQTICCNKTMARVYNVLPQDSFLKINRAFIVNANHVSRFNSSHVILTNGTTVYPSRHFYKAFKEDFLKTTSPKIP